MPRADARGKEMRRLEDKKNTQQAYEITPARQILLRGSQQRMAVMILGKTDVSPLSMSEQIGCSGVSEEGIPEIMVNYGYRFKGISEEKKAAAVLYGVFAHEMLHLIRTDFAYSTEHIEKYPVAEQRIRHMVMNIVEDPAIEYLRSDRLGKFLNRCLDSAIAYFSDTEGDIGDSPDPLSQCLNAMIEFGDLGFIRGWFTFPDAEEMFFRAAPLMNRAVKCPDFKDRFSIAMGIADAMIERWPEAVRSTPSRLVSEKNDMTSRSSMKGGSQSGEDAAPSETALSKRRELTIRLIDGDGGTDEAGQTEGPLPENVSEIKLNVDGSDGKTRQDMPDLSGRDIRIIDEREHGTEKKKAAPKQNGQNSSINTAPLSGTKQPDIENRMPSEEKSAETSDLSAGSMISDSRLVREQEEKGTAGLPKDGSSEKMEETEEKEGRHVEETGNGQDDGSPISRQISKEMMDSIRRSMKETGKSFEKDLREEQRSISENVSSEEIQRIFSTEKELQASEKIKAAKTAALEDIDPEVKSPYYTDVRYYTEKVMPDRMSDADLAFLLSDDDMRRYIDALESGFRKIFRKKRAQKEYKTHGKIDPGRAGGRKMTARIFTKKTLPEDKSDLSIVFLADESGSMQKERRRVEQTLAVLLEALRPFDVKVKVIGFQNGKTPSYRHFGGKEWKNTKKLSSACMKMVSAGGTFLGHAIRYAGLLLEKRPEAHRIFICLTDGVPESSYYKNTSEGLKDCRQAVRDISKFADVIGIGLYSSEKTKASFDYIFSKHSVTMSSLDTLVRVLPEQVKKIIE